MGYQRGSEAWKKLRKHQLKMQRNEGLEQERLKHPYTLVMYKRETNQQQKIEWVLQYENKFEKT